jgi:hypothetical protein
MKPWFRNRTPDAVPGEPSKDTAYEKGRLDERTRRDDAEVTPRQDRARLDGAYERGRRDAQARRRRSPLLTFLTLVLVVIGAGAVYLAVRNGSFSGGGAVVDQNISTVTEKAKAPIEGAADKAGDALKNAGQDIKERAGSSKP